jgi:uncharacterized iron-regulated membrane protein
MRPRRLIALLHRYLGLGLMGFIGLAALTGSALVFGQEIDRLLNPDILSATPPTPGTGPRPLAELVAAATAHQQARDDGPWQALSLLPPRQRRASAPCSSRPDPDAEGRGRFHQVVDPSPPGCWATAPQRPRA